MYLNSERIPKDSYMKKTLLAVVLITALTFVISLYIYSQNRRYYIISTGGGIAYKIDRRTGRTWEIIYDRQILVKGQEELTSPQRKAIAPEDLAIWKVRVLYEKEILFWLRIQKGNLHITGWKAQRIDEQTYLVSYIYKDDTGERGWNFEVNLAAEIVRKVGDDPELLKKYHLTTTPKRNVFDEVAFTPKKDIFDEISSEELNRLSTVIDTNTIKPPAGFVLDKDSNEISSAGKEPKWKSSPIVEPNYDLLDLGGKKDSNNPELKTKGVRFTPLVPDSNQSQPNGKPTRLSDIPN